MKPGVEHLDEENTKVYDLAEHNERMNYLRAKLPELSPLAAKLVLAGSMEKNFIHNLAKFPTTRHEAHWALQTFILMELLREIKALRKELGPEAEKPTLMRREKAK